MAEAERKPRSRKTKVKAKVKHTPISVSSKEDSKAEEEHVDSVDATKVTLKTEDRQIDSTKGDKTVPKHISEPQVEHKTDSSIVEEQKTEPISSAVKQPSDVQENVQVTPTIEEGTSEQIPPKSEEDSSLDEEYLEVQDKDSSVVSSNQVSVSEGDSQDDGVKSAEAEKTQADNSDVVTGTETDTDARTFLPEGSLETHVVTSDENSDVVSEDVSVPEHVPDAVVEENRAETPKEEVQGTTLVNLIGTQEEEDEKVQAEQLAELATDVYSMPMEESPSEDTLPQGFAQPLTEDQLQSLYDNPLLPQLEEWVDCFLQQTNQNKHEFYQLVQQYYRSRVSLAEVQAGITELQSKQEQLKGELWVTTDHVVTAQGHCHDNVKVTQTQNYKQVELSGVTCVELSRVLHDTRVQVHEMFTLAGYSAMLCRLQVETYLHQVLSTCHPDPDSYDPNMTAQRERLRSCISVLFTFQRRPIRDQQFLEDTRTWLEKLCCCLLATATFHDHLFLLNHVLRCPSGVGAWAASLIQVPCPLPDDATDLASAKVHQFLVLLATLFNPIRSRSDLLKLLKPVQVAGQTQGQADTPLNWTLVDEGGEEEDDSADTWALLHENDLVMLLQQFPFNRFFCHIMNIQLSDTDLVVSAVTEQHMLWLFALCSTLVKLLSEGLRNFNRSRYRQFVKRLGRLVRHTIQHVSEVWKLCKRRLEQVQGDALGKLQVEYDHFFYRSVVCILSAPRVGALQFLSDLPYQQLSHTMQWQLLWLLHVENIQDSPPGQAATIPQIKALLQESDMMVQLEDKLCDLEQSEAIFLMTACTNMARSHVGTDTDFVDMVVTHLYQVCYVSSRTREFCSKVGRELLSSICLVHPTAVSTLLDRVGDTMEQVGLMSLYLYKEMPLHLWQPQSADMVLLETWLLKSELSSPQHRLTRLIVAQLNWGTNDQGDRLFLPLALHRWMGLLLTQVCNHFLYNKEQAGLLAAGIKQVTQLAAAARLTVGPEQQLSTWLWEVVLQLRLHTSEQPQQALTAGVDAHTTMDKVPNLTNDPSLQHLQRAVKTDMPIAFYIALAMTSVGNDKNEFLSSGLPLLLHLVEGGHIVPTIHVLAKVTPLFLTCQQNLLQEKRFLKIVEKVIQSDHSLTSSELGPNCKLLCSMIQFQVQSGFVSARVSSTTVLEFWVRMLTSLPQWWYNTQVLLVLDSLLQTAFRCKGGEDMTISILYDRYKALLSTKTDPGVLVSLVSWMSSSAGPPTFLDKPTQSGVWVAYQVLQAESMWEEDTQLRKMLESALHQDSSVSVEGAVKNVSSELHLPSAPPLHRLMIYRWAQQALATPLDHALLPLIWQHFFQIYLHRPAADSGMSGRGGVGHRFFQAHSQSSLLKKLKKRLQEAADFHYAASKTPAALQVDGPSEAAAEDQTEEPLVPSSDPAGVHQKLSKLFHSFYLWIDEPRLHDPNLYLPALPQQYDAERLLCLFKNSQDAWLEFVDMDRVERDIAVMATEWVQHHQVKTVGNSKLSPDFSQPATSPMERHLMTSDLTQVPPSAGEQEPPVPEVAPQVLEDTTLLLATVEPHLQHLLHQARIFTEREQRHLMLDNTYLDLIPDHYHNKHVTLNLQIPCHSSFTLSSPTCKGPAQITLQYQEKTLDTGVDSQLKENRLQAEQLVDSAMNPPQQQLCASALFVERLITDLVNHSSSQQQNAGPVTKEVGTSLFYKMVRCVDEDNRHYAPTRQFFSSCIEALGQAFIRNNPAQAEFLLRAMLIMDSEFIGKNPDEAGRLLQATLATPALCGLLGPHFSPNQAGVTFINMYADVTHVPDSHGVDLAFMLLTKFDVQMWLESCRPSLTDRSHLVDTIGKALLLCGPQPKTDMLMVFEVYQSHLQTMLRYSFPDHFGDVLMVLLQGSDSKQLSPLCWKNTLRTLGCAEELGTSADSVTLSLLTPQQVTETLGWLSSHFMQLRSSSQQLAVNGLYCEMQQYVLHIGQLLGLLFTTLLQAEFTGSVVPSHNFEGEVENLWTLLRTAYEPWLASVDAAKLGNSVPSGVGLCMPWTEKESGLASGVMANFTNCLHLLFSRYKGALPTHSQDVLALTWRYYASSLARSDQPHVLRVYHDSLVTLPWEHFYPDIHAFNLMMKLLEECHPVCQSFLCSVFIRLDCLTLVADYCSHDLPEIVARLHECLLHLLVHFSVLESEAVSGKLQEAEQFAWHYLSAAAYQNNMSWLVDAANPDLVLSQAQGQAPSQPISLMKTAAGFKPETQVQYADVCRKQQLYVHGVVELVCRCVARRKVNISCYQPVITGLLADIESLAGSALDSHHQRSQMVALLSEALGLLNNCPPDEKKVETLARFFWEWLESNSCSCLVLPVVTAGCRTLASPAHMARMVECGIEVFLNSGLEENVQSGWDQVLAAVEIPELAQQDFLSECLQHGCFLTLYAYVLQRLPMCQLPKEEMLLADQLLSWTAAAKPRADNEAKLLLWWWQVLRICLQQVDRNQPYKDVFCALMNLTSSLTTLGEDKSAAGLLGALGLGKRSPLSHRFRLVCRGLSTYLLAQARSVSFLRLWPGDPHGVGQVMSAPLPGNWTTAEGPSPKAVQSLTNLEALQTNKQYSTLKSHIQYIYSFTLDPLHTLRDAPALLAHLSKVLFQEQNYLSLLQAHGAYSR